MKTWRDIAGWFIWPEFYDEVVESCVDGETLVEIGTFHGKSICYLAGQAKKRHRNLRVVGIELSPVYAKETLNNLAACGLSAEILVGDSADAAAQFDDGSLTLVFNDIEHAQDASHEATRLRTLEQLKIWRPKVKPGGYMAGHDYIRTGIQVAVAEIFPAAKCDAWNCWIAKTANNSNNISFEHGR